MHEFNDRFMPVVTHIYNLNSIHNPGEMQWQNLSVYVTDYVFKVILYLSMPVI